MLIISCWLVYERFLILIGEKLRSLFYLSLYVFFIRIKGKMKHNLFFSYIWYSNIKKLCTSKGSMMVHLLSLCCKDQCCGYYKRKTEVLVLCFFLFLCSCLLQIERKTECTSFVMFFLLWLSNIKKPSFERSWKSLCSC